MKVWDMQQYIVTFTCEPKPKIADIVRGKVDPLGNDPNYFVNRCDR